MNKFGKISLITASSLAIIAGGGAILYNNVPAVKNTFDKVIKINRQDKASIGDKNQSFEHEDSAYYINLITEYTRQIESLKYTIESNKAEYEKTISEKQSEIDSLNAEVDELTSAGGSEELIKQKNERIASLTSAIQTLQAEQEETNAEHEKEIENLNKLISKYESRILSTLKLPKEFIIENTSDVGFSIIENNDFVIYNKFNSCNLLYYHFENKQVESIPVKAKCFSCFKRVGQELYFVSNDMLYVFNFDTKQSEILAPIFDADYVSYELIDSKLYIFNTGTGYAVRDVVSKEFKNLLIDSETTSGILSCRFLIEDYIFFTGSFMTSSRSIQSCISVLNTKNNEPSKIICEKINNYCTEVNVVGFEDNIYIKVDNSLYKFDKENVELKEIKTGLNRFANISIINNHLMLFDSTKCYLVENETITNVGTLSLSSTSSLYNVKYVSVGDESCYIYSNNIAGIWKVDFSTKTIIQINNSVGSYFNEIEIGKYKFLKFTKNLVVFDKESYSLDLLKANSNCFLYSLDCDNYVLLYEQSRYSSGETCPTSSYVYIYNKVDNTYYALKNINGAVSSINSVHAPIYKNGRLYIRSVFNNYSIIYIYDLSLNTIPITSFSYDSSLSDYINGIFYVKVGSIEDADVYVRYVLQEDNSFTKELVVI